jgi:predicted RNA-binding protein with RPS1 domain
VSTELAATASGDIPPEVEALDGINSDEEQHNAERPARKSIKKKGPKGKPLSELKVGDVIRAKAKTIASYGAFMDIGAESDGLLHISQLSVDFVKDVNDVLKVGEEYDVRITKIDAEKKQVALTLLSEAQEEEAAAAAAAAANERQAKREQRTKQQQQTTARRDDSAIVDELQSKGWDPTKFVDGTVVSIVDFGAFVRIDCSQLNPDIQGSMDGLVHISALAKGRVDSVQSIVKIDDQVKVRVKSIDNRKVSLTMVSAEDEASIKEARATSVSSASSGSSEGAKDWKESLKKMQEDLPEFKNRPLIVDNRKS